VIWRKPANVVLVEHGTDRCGEDQAGVVPQLAGLQAVRNLDCLALTEGAHGNLRQSQGAPGLRSLGVVRSVLMNIDRGSRP
jgi:hypothetical protein